MSAIGPAVEAFGKYARVEKLSGEEVTVGELLEYVRKVVGEFALKRILEEGELGGGPPCPLLRPLALRLQPRPGQV